MTYYTLKDREVVETDDPVLLTDGERVVAQERVGKFFVSTVFIYLDHGVDYGRPLVFESMVFEGCEEVYCERYSTWRGAEMGHTVAVRWAKKNQSWIGRVWAWMAN